MSEPATAPAVLLPAGIAILGPTGCGKSALALQLAASLPVEIVSVDSAQVYRGLDIGTAKPSAAERAAVIHHLIDIRDPDEAYSAGQFRTDALQLIRDIAARGHVPLLVGGTMLYFRALFRGIADLPTADVQLRHDIDARAAREGWPSLHAELGQRDPQAAARIHPHDAQRIQRALELAQLSGQTLQQLWATNHQERFDHWQVGVLHPEDRVPLHAALERRLDDMFDAGFVAEVRHLVARNLLSDDSHTSRLVGYRQVLAHVRGEEPLPVSVAKALAATRQLAKRQITWLRGNNLLPFGATVVRADPFDAVSTQFFVQSLIKGIASP